MQIVIDIPEELKGKVDIRRNSDVMISQLMHAVRLGTVLPENHGDLIDKDILLITLKAWDKGVNGMPNYAWHRIRDAKVVLEGTK